MLENETYEKAYKKFRTLERNQQAIITSLIGIFSIGVSLALFSFLPKADPVVKTSMEEYLSIVCLILFIGGLFLLLIGTTFFSFKTKCKFCKMKV
jgi:hypothetical protein